MSQLAQCLPACPLRCSPAGGSGAGGEAEEIFRQFLEYANLQVAMLDTDLRYLCVSRRWRETLNMPDADLTGRRHVDVVRGESPERLALMRRCLAGAVERCEQERWVRPDGGVDWFRWEMRPWR